MLHRSSVIVLATSNNNEEKNVNNKVDVEMLMKIRMKHWKRIKLKIGNPRRNKFKRKTIPTENQSLGESFS